MFTESVERAIRRGRGSAADTDRHSGFQRRAWHPAVTFRRGAWSDCSEGRRHLLSMQRRRSSTNPTCHRFVQQSPRRPTSSSDWCGPGTCRCWERRPHHGTRRSSLTSPPCRSVRQDADGPTPVDSSGTASLRGAGATEPSGRCGRCGHGRPSLDVEGEGVTSPEPGSVAGSEFGTLQPDEALDFLGAAHDWELGGVWDSPRWQISPIGCAGGQHLDLG
jgi:hypothetical protein